MGTSKAGTQTAGEFAACLKVLPLGIGNDCTERGIVLLRKRPQTAGAGISDGGYELIIGVTKIICKLKYAAEHRRVALKLRDRVAL